MKRNVVVKALGALVCLFMLSASTVWAEPCLADYNYDGKVTGADLSLLKQEYGRWDCSEQNPCQADGNGDGKVTGADLTLLKNEYGRTDCLICEDIDGDGYDTCNADNPHDTDGKPADCVDGDVTVTVGQVVLEVLDTNAHLGDGWGQVAISMCNPDHKVKGIQLDLVDDGNDLICTRCAPDPDRAYQFICSTNELEDGKCRVFMTTTNPSALISEGEGPIFTIDYTIDENIPAEGCVDLTIENSLVSDEFINPLCAYKDGGEICFIACGDVYPRECLPESPICGDGVVDIFDRLEVIDFALGIVEPSDCQRVRADVPTGTPPYCTAPDGEINDLDVLVIIDMTLSKMNCCDYYYFGEIY